MLNEKLFKELIQDEINSNEKKRKQMTRYLDYYRGDHNILRSKKKGDVDLPHNQSVFNFPELIVDTNHSYLFSKPYSMDIKSQSNTIQRLLGLNNIEKETQEFIDEVQTIYFDCNEENITSTHGKITAITGESVELHYIDNQGNIRFIETDPREWTFFTYDNTDYALRTYKTHQYVPTTNGKGYIKEETERGELYTDEMIFDWEKGEKGWELQGETRHFYGELPVIRFQNRDSVYRSDSTSDLKNVIGLVDSYNATVSSLINTLEYSGDPYLVLKGMTLGEDAAEQIRESRVIEIMQDYADVSFLQWDQNISAFDSTLGLIERMIFILSFTPDLFAKEGLSSDSGVSLKMKFAGADLKSQQKERSFIKGIKKRLRLIARQLENRTPSKHYFSKRIYQNIEITFNRNMPQNLEELANIVSTLSGTVSDETRLKLLPFVSNAAEEVEKMKSDDRSGMSNLFGDTE